MTHYARPHLVCPSCEGNNFKVAIQDFGFKRVIVDCHDCQGRCSIPIDNFDRRVKQQSVWAKLKQSTNFDVDI